MAALKTLIYIVCTLTVFTGCVACRLQTEDEVEDRQAPVDVTPDNGSEMVSNNTTENQTSLTGSILGWVFGKIEQIFGLLHGPSKFHFGRSLEKQHKMKPQRVVNLQVNIGNFSGQDDIPKNAPRKHNRVGTTIKQQIKKTAGSITRQFKSIGERLKKVSNFGKTKKAKIISSFNKIRKEFSNNSYQIAKNIVNRLGGFNRFLQ